MRQSPLGDTDHEHPPDSRGVSRLLFAPAPQAPPRPHTHTAPRNPVARSRPTRRRRSAAPPQRSTRPKTDPLTSPCRSSRDRPESAVHTYRHRTAPNEPHEPGARQRQGRATDHPAPGTGPTPAASALLLPGGRALPAPDLPAPQRGGRRLSSSTNHRQNTAPPRAPREPPTLLDRRRPTALPRYRPLPLPTALPRYRPRHPATNHATPLPTPHADPRLGQESPFFGPSFGTLSRSARTTRLRTVPPLRLVSVNPN